MSFSLSCLLQQRLGRLLLIPIIFGDLPIVVDFDGKRQGPEEPQSGIITAKEIICNQPCMGSLLKSLQMFLDKVDLGGVPSVCRVIELRHELRGVRGSLKVRIV
jgi:hypothetical protein